MSASDFCCDLFGDDLCSWLIVDTAESADVMAHARASGACALALRGAIDPRVVDLLTGGPKIFVEASLDDDAPITAAGLAGFILDARSGADVQQFGARLAVREAEAGLPDGALRIVARLNAPAAVLNIRGFAGASKRLAGLMLGTAFARSDSAPCVTARGLVVLGAAAAGAPALIEIDPDGSILDACAKALADGFAGALVSRPEHINAVNRTFVARIDKSP